MLERSGKMTLQSLIEFEESLDVAQIIYDELTKDSPPFSPVNHRTELYFLSREQHISLHDRLLEIFKDPKDAEVWMKSKITDPISGIQIIPSEIVRTSRIYVINMILETL